MSWLRRRGPGLPNGLLQRLFRLRKVLCLQPVGRGGKPKRAAAHAPLAEGARVLIPKSFAASAPALATRSSGARRASPGTQRADAPHPVVNCMSDGNQVRLLVYRPLASSI